MLARILVALPGRVTLPHLDFIYGVMPLLALGLYLWLQVRALKRFRRGWWRMACLPAAAMAGALLVSLFGGLSGANLAPIWFFLTLPVALLFLLALYAVKALKEMRRWGIIADRG